MNNKNLALKAPLSGPVMPLNRVPDPVFSSGTLGEGIAIDPLNDCLHAPCAGLVSHLARTRHALSLRADNGAEPSCCTSASTPYSCKAKASRRWSRKVRG